MQRQLDGVGPVQIEMMIMPDTTLDNLSFIAYRRVSTSIK
jgi:hypothetical protein